MTVVPREQALANGLKRYCTGLPCVKGHVCERYTGSKVCVECRDTWQRAHYQRKKAEGFDFTIYSRRHYKKHPERCRGRSKTWRRKHPEKTRAQLIAWEKNNKETRRAIVRRRYEKSRDTINAKMRVWSRANRARLRGKRAHRKAIRLRAMPLWVDRRELSWMYRQCPSGMHVDHIVPLVSKIVCGLHVPWNLQYLTPAANLAKGNSLCL